MEISLPFNIAPTESFWGVCVLDPGLTTISRPSCYQAPMQTVRVPIEKQRQNVGLYRKLAVLCTCLGSYARKCMLRLEKAIHNGALYRNFFSISLFCAHVPAIMQENACFG